MADGVMADGARADGAMAGGAMADGATDRTSSEAGGRPGAGRQDPEFGAGRRGRLLSAAAQVFAEKGYRATSMNDLADAVGISKATLYHYVSSKQQLLVELYEAVMQGTLYVVDRAGLLGLSPEEALRKVLVQRIVYICRHVRLVQIFVEEQGELPAEMVDRMRQGYGRREDAFVRLIERGVADGSFELGVDPRVAARAIIGALTYVHKWYDPDGPRSPEELAEELADYLVRGLRPVFAGPARVRLAFRPAV